MLELEKRKEQLDLEIINEQHRLETPKVKKEHIIYWLEKFKDGNIHDIAYQRKIIDTFVHEIKVYDDKIIIAYNYSGEKRKNTVNISDSTVFEFDLNGGG